MKTAILGTTVVTATVGLIALGTLGIQKMVADDKVSSAENVTRCMIAEKNVMRLVTSAHAGGYRDGSIDDDVVKWAQPQYGSVVMTPFEISIARALVARREAWKDFVPSKKMVHGYGYTDDFNSLIPVVMPIYNKICMSM